MVNGQRRAVVTAAPDVSSHAGDQHIWNDRRCRRGYRRPPKEGAPEGSVRLVMATSGRFGGSLVRGGAVQPRCGDEDRAADLA